MFLVSDFEEVLMEYQLFKENTELLNLYLEQRRQQKEDILSNDNLESLLRRQIHLLCLGNFFEKFLNDNSVIVSNIGRGDLEGINGRNDVEFQLAIAGGLKDSGVDLDLFHTGTVQLL